jgi:hypothetical protein
MRSRFVGRERNAEMKFGRKIRGCGAVERSTNALF